MTPPRIILLAAATLLLATLAPTASAHQRVDVADDKYQLILGWEVEPTYAGEPNGLALGVNRYVQGEEASDGHGGTTRPTEPVSGLVGNLTVTYEIAGQTFTPPEWRAQHGREGWYTAEITPTREGQYTVHIVGDIEGNPIDVRIEPHVVESLELTMFPEPDLTSEETTRKIAQLEEQIATLEAELEAMRTSQQSATPPTLTDQGGNDTPAPGLVAVLVLGAVAALVLRRRT